MQHCQCPQQWASSKAANRAKRRDTYCNLPITTVLLTRHLSKLTRVIEAPAPAPAASLTHSR